MSGPHAFRAASEYIEKLRDPRRRKYAREFYGFLRARGREPYPPNPTNLTTMAAQAVRMELLDIMEPAGYGLPRPEWEAPELDDEPDFSGPIDGSPEDIDQRIDDALYPETTSPVGESRGRRLGGAPGPLKGEARS